MSDNNTTIDAELTPALEGQAQEMPLAIRPGDKLAPATQAQPLTAAQAKIHAIADLTAAAYHRASQLALTPEESKSLQAIFPDEAFQTGAGGKSDLIYIEHAALRGRLNEVFGIGQWAIIPRSRWSEEYRTSTGKDATRVYVEAMLLVRGCFVAEAVGDMAYFPHNAEQNYGDAVEGAKTAALRRCCKELGVGLQAWSRDWCKGWWARKHGSKPSQSRPVPPQHDREDHPDLAPASKPEPKQQATAAFRASMIKNLMAGPGQGNRDISTEYFRKVAQLLPNEAVEDLPLRFVPTTKEQMEALSLAIAGFAAGDEAKIVMAPNTLEAPEKPRAADDRPRTTGTIQSVSEKPGEKNGKTYVRYGVKVGNEWFNTFDSKIADRAKLMKGSEATIVFKETKFGKDVLEIL